MKKILICLVAFVALAATTVNYRVPVFPATEFTLGTDNVLHVVPGAKTVMGIQAYNVTTDGSGVGTQTWATAYASVPITVLSPTDVANYTLTVTTITITGIGFTATASKHYNVIATGSY